MSNLMWHYKIKRSTKSQRNALTEEGVNFFDTVLGNSPVVYMASSFLIPTQSFFKRRKDYIDAKHFGLLTCFAKLQYTGKFSLYRTHASSLPDKSRSLVGDAVLTTRDGKEDTISWISHQEFMARVTQYYSKYEPKKKVEFYPLPSGAYLVFIRPAKGGTHDYIHFTLEASEDVKQWPIDFI